MEIEQQLAWTSSKGWALTPVISVGGGNTACCQMCHSGSNGHKRIYDKIVLFLTHPGSSAAKGLSHSKQTFTVCSHINHRGGGYNKHAKKNALKC